VARIEPIGLTLNGGGFCDLASCLKLLHAIDLTTNHANIVVAMKKWEDLKAGKPKGLISN
jgi:hypothetical protein